VPYYYYQGIDNTITKEEVETQFEEYVNENLPLCVAGFATLNESQYQVTAGEVSADVVIDDITGMAVNVNYPLTIQTDNRVEQVEKFSQTYDVRIGTLLDVSSQIVDRVAEEPRAIPMSYLIDLGVENDLQIDTFTYGDDTVLYLIQDNRSLAGTEPLLFVFATKMDVEAHMPVITAESLSARVGEEFRYVVDASDLDGDGLSFADDSELFDVDPVTAEIEFTPTSAGVHTFTIYAFDGINEVSQEFTLTIS
jgi:hypothetical protein